MNYILVVFASVTTANRLKSLIRKKYGIESTIVQTPGSIRLKGCSYALKMEGKYADTVWKIITDSGLSSKGIYTEGDYLKIR